MWNKNKNKIALLEQLIEDNSNTIYNIERENSNLRKENNKLNKELRILKDKIIELSKPIPYDTTVTWVEFKKLISSMKPKRNFKKNIDGNDIRKLFYSMGWADCILKINFWFEYEKEKKDKKV